MEQFSHASDDHLHGKQTVFFQTNTELMNNWVASLGHNRREIQRLSQLGVACFGNRTAAFQFPRQPLPGIESGISDDLFGILKGIEVQELTQESMGGLFTDARNAAQQLLFSAKIVILRNVGVDELFHKLDLSVEIGEMLFQDADHIRRANAALEPVDLCLAGGIQVFQKTYQGLKLTQFLSGRVPGRWGLCAAEVRNDSRIKTISLVAGQQAFGIGADPGGVDQADQVIGGVQDFC